VARQTDDILISKGLVFLRALGIMAAGTTNIFTSVAFAELGLSVMAVERGQRRTRLCLKT
jgi:hypothetical protein